MIYERAGGFYGSIYHRKCNTVFYEWLTSKRDLFMINVHTSMWCQSVFYLSANRYDYSYILLFPILWQWFHREVNLTSSP